MASTVAANIFTRHASDGLPRGRYSRTLSKGVGSGITVLNNLAQIGISLGVEGTTILLSVFSFCNFIGRLGAGAISEHFVRLKTLPRTFWMTITQVIMIIAFLLYASALDGILYVATALLGMCYGVQYSIMVATVSELFGLKHFGVLVLVHGRKNNWFHLIIWNLNFGECRC